MCKVVFESFGKNCEGTVVTGNIVYIDGWADGFIVAFARNPYGGHNLVLIECDKDSAGSVARVHGGAAVVAWLVWAGQVRMLRKVLAFEARHGRRYADLSAGSIGGNFKTVAEVAAVK